MREEAFIYHVGQSALRAILYEVSATPKPGLVDRNNNGAHQDMDFYTFMDSASALHGVFDRFTKIGIESAQRSFKETRRVLQQYGIEAEEEMFRRTKGINTHKGIIFSLGFLCGAIGRLGPAAELSVQNITDEVKRLCSGLSKQAFAGLKEKVHLTKGEAVYLKYGIGGARAEAESGFQTVTEISLPIFIREVEKGSDINTACIRSLLELIANTKDTNILSRHNMEIAEEARNNAAAVLNQSEDEAVDMKAVKQLDELFIQRNISPGGCADLLAVTLFFYFIHDQRHFSV